MSGGEPQEETEQEEEEEPSWSELCAAPPPEWVGERVMPLLRSLRGYACLAHMRPAFTYDPGGEHLRQALEEHYSDSAEHYSSRAGRRWPRLRTYFSAVFPNASIRGGRQSAATYSYSTWMAHLFHDDPEDGPPVPGQVPQRGPRTIEFLSPVLQKLGGTMGRGQEFVRDCSMASTKQLIEEGDGIPPDLLSALHVLLLLAHLQQTLPNGAYFEVLEAILEQHDTSVQTLSTEAAGGGELGWLDHSVASVLAPLRALADACGTDEGSDAASTGLEGAARQFLESIWDAFDPVLRQIQRGAAESESGADALKDFERRMGGLPQRGEFCNRPCEQWMALMLGGLRMDMMGGIGMALPEFNVWAWVNTGVLGPDQFSGGVLDGAEVAGRFERWMTPPETLVGRIPTPREMDGASSDDMDAVDLPLQDGLTTAAKFPPIFSVWAMVVRLVGTSLQQSGQYDGDDCMDDQRVDRIRRTELCALLPSAAAWIVSINDSQMMAGDVVSVELLFQAIVRVAKACASLSTPWMRAVTAPRLASLRLLTFSGWPLQDEGVMALVASLSTAGAQIEDLCLTFCGVGDAGAVALGDLLRASTSLVNLHASCNFAITDRGLAAMLEGAADGYVAGTSKLKSLHVVQAESPGKCMVQGATPIVFLCQETHGPFARPSDIPACLDSMKSFTDMDWVNQYDLANLANFRKIRGLGNPMGSIESLASESSAIAEDQSVVDAYILWFAQALCRELPAAPFAAGILPDDFELHLNIVAFQRPSAEQMAEDPETGDTRVDIGLVRSFFERMKSGGEDRNWQLKLMLVGVGEAGKTSMLNALAQREHLTDGTADKRTTEAANRTVGVDICSWKPKDLGHTDSEITFNAWDMAGQEDYYITHQLFLTDKAAYLLSVNLERCTDANLGTVKQQGLLYLTEIQTWLDQLQSRVPDAVVAVVGTHCDLVEGGYAGEEVARRCKLLAKMIDHAQKRRKSAINKDIKELELELQEIKKHTSDLGSKSGAALGHNPLKQRINELKERRGKTLTFAGAQDGSALRVYPISSLSGDGIAELRQTLVQLAQPQHFSHLGTVVPSSDLALAAKVRQMRREGTHYCKWSDFVEVCKECQITKENAVPVTKWLHSIGEVLFFEGEGLTEFVFVDPQWLVDAVKLIIRHDIREVLQDEDHKEFCDYVELEDIDFEFDRHKDPTDPTTDEAQFEEMKARFLKDGYLARPLLRALWAGLGTPLGRKPTGEDWTTQDSNMKDNLEGLLVIFDVATLVNKVSRSSSSSDDPNREMMVEGAATFSQNNRRLRHQLERLGSDFLVPHYLRNSEDLQLTGNNNWHDYTTPAMIVCEPPRSKPPPKPIIRQLSVWLSFTSYVPPGFMERLSARLSKLWPDQKSTLWKGGIQVQLQSRVLLRATMHAADSATGLRAGKLKLEARYKGGGDGDNADEDAETEERNFAWRYFHKWFKCAYKLQKWWAGVRTAWHVPCPQCLTEQMRCDSQVSDDTVQLLDFVVLKNCMRDVLRGGDSYYTPGEGSCGHCNPLFLLAPPAVLSFKKENNDEKLLARFWRRKGKNKSHAAAPPAKTLNPAPPTADDDSAALAQLAKEVREVRSGVGQVLEQNRRVVANQDLMIASLKATQNMVVGLEIHDIPTLFTLEMDSPELQAMEQDRRSNLEKADLGTFFRDLQRRLVKAPKLMLRLVCQHSYEAVGQGYVVKTPGTTVTKLMPLLCRGLLVAKAAGKLAPIGRLFGLPPLSDGITRSAESAVDGLSKETMPALRDAVKRAQQTAGSGDTSAVATAVSQEQVQEFKLFLAKHDPKEQWKQDLVQAVFRDGEGDDGLLRRRGYSMAGTAHH